jgi:adenylate cyclase
MTLSHRSRREWRRFIRISAAIAVVSVWYGVAVRQPDSSIAMAVVVSVVTSLIVGTPIVLIELNRYRVPFLSNLRHLPLAIFFAIKVAFYIVVIIAGLFLSRVVMQPLTGDRLDIDAVFRTSIVFSIVMSIAFNVVFEIGGLLGFRTVKNLLTGRYVKPRREQRAFLLIDMKNSTGLAERLGPLLFHELLNDFFRDIADAAVECEAEIHKYVGDEAILTWSGADALGDGDCLACPFIAQDFIEASRARYLARFGEVPSFRAASHYGEIVTGEIGDLRREIAYVGDTLNVAARLLEAAKELGRDVLVSTDLLGHAALPPELTAEKLPMLTMRGRAAPLGAAALGRNAVSRQ